MRRQDYRRAVGSIRWSPEQRRAIEEQLRKPVRSRSKQVKEVEQILRQKPAYYAEQEEFMKKERKKARVYLYILAAAMLAIGGTAAVVAYSSKKDHSEGNVSEESSRSDHSISEEDLVNAVISPNLTDQQDTPDAHGFAKTDSGLFFIGQENLNYSGKDIWAYDDTYLDLALRYYDEASGESVYLCAKPNCLHDGNEFCTATTQNYLLCSDPVYLDGYVYAIALDKQEELKNPDDCDKFPTVLLRYAPDGTEITPVAQLHFDEVKYSISAELVAHRGQLWINCTYLQVINAYDSAMELTDQQQFGGYEMFCYEPETQKLTTLSTSGDLQMDYRPFSSVEAELKGVGDYVYFHKYAADWRDPLKDGGVFRIDCRTGVISQVVEAATDKTRFYTVSGDRIYYSVGQFSAANPAFHVYDLTTGVDTELFTLEKVVQSVDPDFVYDESLEGMGEIHTYSICSDETYLNITWYYYDRDEAAKYEGKEEEYLPSDMLTVLDRDGNVVKTVNLRDAEGVEKPREIIDIQVAKYADAFNIKTEEQKNEFISHTEAHLSGWFARYDNGTFYLQSGYVQYRMTVEDILHGSLKPEPLYVWNMYK